jgi:hypothetical protein
LLDSGEVTGGERGCDLNERGLLLNVSLGHEEEEEEGGNGKS